MHLLHPIIAQASPDQVAALEAIAFFVMAFFFVFLAIGIVCLIAGWKVYAKAGQPGWAVLIPVYNLIVYLRIVGLPWYWVFTPLIALIPILGWIAYMAWAVWLNHRLSTRFGHGVGFTLGLIFLPFIFWLILAFGSSQYVGEDKAQA